MEKYLYRDLYNLEDQHWWHIAKRSNVLSLLNKYARPKNPSILDIGCGTGKNVETMSKIGSASGVDNSPEAIKFCSQRQLKQVSLGTSDKTGFKDNSLNIVTLLDVLEHVDEDKTLDEVYRILKDDGFVIITVPAFSWLWSRWDEVLHHRRRYDQNTLLKALTQHQFKILKTSYMFSFLVIPALFIRLIKNLIYKNHYPSDFKLSSPFINNIMSLVSYIERLIILKWSIPIGTSLVCIAQKDERR